MGNADSSRDVRRSDGPQSSRQGGLVIWSRGVPGATEY